MIDLRKKMRNGYWWLNSSFRFDKPIGTVSPLSLQFEETFLRLPLLKIILERRKVWNRALLYNTNNTPTIQQYDKGGGWGR